MNNYVTGAVIKRLREKKKLTQEELAQKIFVTSKAVSKWENGRGFPDIGILESLGHALGVSVVELLSGNSITNMNKSCNMAKGKFYVCPVCGNIIQTTGDALASCCGITLPALEGERADDEHFLSIETIEDEYYVTISHPMTKDHYISFIAAISDMGVKFVKLYPEGNAEARFKINRVKKMYAYCNRHGLFEV